MSAANTNVRNGDLWMRRINIRLDSDPLDESHVLRSRTTLERERMIERDGYRIRDISMRIRTTSGIEAVGQLALQEHS